MYGSDDGGFFRRETEDCGRTGIRHGWTTNNMLRGDEGPGHFPEDEEPDQNDEVLCCPDCERPNQFGEQEEPYEVGMGFDD